jgi:predicted phosphodiesterase
MNMKDTHSSDQVPRREVILEDEAGQRHILVGDFLTSKNYEYLDNNQYLDITIHYHSILVHEHPDGSAGEHRTLRIPQGNWSMGSVEKFNPLSRFTQ